MPDKMNPDDARRFLADSAAWRDTHHTLRTNWVGNLSYFIDAIAARTANPSDYSLFWVRLWAVQFELNDHFRLLRDAQAVQAVRPSESNEAKWGRRLIAELDAINAALTEEEWIYVDYKRNSVAHMVPQGYRLHVTKDKRLLDRHRVMTLPEDRQWRPCDELDRILDALLRSFTSENAIAEEIAPRIAAPVERLWQMMKEG